MKNLHQPQLSQIQLLNKKFAHRENKIFLWAKDWIHDLHSQYHADINYLEDGFCLTLASEGVDCIGISDNQDRINASNILAKELEVADVLFRPFEKQKIFYDTISYFGLENPDLIELLSNMGLWVLVTSKIELDLSKYDVKDTVVIDGFNCYLFKK